MVGLGLYYQDIIKIINQLKQQRNATVLRVWLANVKQYCQYQFAWLNRADRARKNSSNAFYNLIYKLQQYHVEITDDDLASLLNTQDYTYTRFDQHIDELNKELAKRIIELIHPQSKTIAQYQKLELKRLYYTWLRSWPISMKAYIKREKNIPAGQLTEAVKPADAHKTYQFIENTADAEVIKAKQINFLKLFLYLQAHIAIIFTAIGQGLLPAVLATTGISSLMWSIVSIGVPSIIINYVLLNGSVKELMADIRHGRLLGTDGNKLNKIIAFILGLCAGLTLGILMFETSVMAFNVIFGLLFPAASTLLALQVPILLAAILSLYAGMALTALYVTSALELCGDNFLAKIGKFFTDLFATKDILFISRELILNFAIVAGASYLAIIESVIFYASAMSLFNIPLAASIMVVLAFPANAMFTTVVYRDIADAIKNLPAILSSIIKYITKNYTNPIACYEDIKLVLSNTILWAFSVDNSLALGTGMVQESREPACAAIFARAGINTQTTYFQYTTQVVTVLDSIGANGEGIIHTLGNPIAIEDSDTVDLRPAP